MARGQRRLPPKPPRDHAWRRGTHIADPRQGDLLLLLTDGEKGVRVARRAGWQPRVRSHLLATAGRAHCEGADHEGCQRQTDTAEGAMERAPNLRIRDRDPQSVGSSRFEHPIYA